MRGNTLFSEILRPACLIPTTMPPSKSLESSFFLIQFELVLMMPKRIGSLPWDWLIRYLC